MSLNHLNIISAFQIANITPFICLSDATVHWLKTCEFWLSLLLG